MIDEQRYAVQLQTIERIVRIVELTSLPESPGMVIGVINIQGQIIPVIDLHKGAHSSNQEISLSDRLIVVNTSKRRVALKVDIINDVINASEQEVIPATMIASNMKYIEGAIKVEDNIVFLPNIEEFVPLMK